MDAIKLLTLETLSKKSTPHLYFKHTFGGFICTESQALPGFSFQSGHKLFVNKRYEVQTHKLKLNKQMFLKKKNFKNMFKVKNLSGQHFRLNISKTSKFKALDELTIKNTLALIKSADFLYKSEICSGAVKSSKHLDFKNITRLCSIWIGCWPNELLQTDQ